MVKNLKFRETMRTLGLRTYENCSERSIVRNLFDVYQSIGSKARSKDANTSQGVLTSTIVEKEMEKSCMIRKISKSLRISRTMLVKALERQEIIEDSKNTYFCSFQGRLPCKDKYIVDALRILIENLWCDNTRALTNQRDVVKRRIGIKIVSHMQNIFGI